MRVALVLFALLLGSCAPIGSDDVQTPLRSFESSAQQLSDGFVALGEHVITAKAALTANDTAKLDAFFTQLPKDLDPIEQAATTLEAAEDALQTQPTLGTASIQQGLGSGKGFMASLRKTFDITAKYRAWSDEVSAARTEREAAQQDLLDGVEGAGARMTAAQQKMNGVAQNVTGHLATNISTTLVTSPFQPVTLGGKILKAVGGKVYEKGLVVITSTKPCETDVKASTCVLGIEKTDEQGQIKAPAGTNSLAISGHGYARVRVDSTEVASPPTALVRALVPLAQVKASEITKGDEVDQDGFPVDPVYVPWIFCFNRSGGNAIGGGCVKFDAGNINAWDALTSTQQGAWCAGKGFSDGQYSYMDEAGCRTTCRQFAASPCISPCTAFVCSTP